MDNFLKVAGVMAMTGVTVCAVRLYGHVKEVEGFAKGCEVTINAYEKAEKKNDNK
jgi:hypothetical protein